LNPAIALLTDFGLQDPFVGIMKGVLAGLAPKAAVVDLCHGVPPQDIKTGALFLRMAAPFFPAKTLFVAVVDPGVGSRRRVLFARTKRQAFLAPDNGLLSWLPERVLEWRSVENAKLFLPEVSTTFHGRDVFAPVAARLARGLPPAALGPKISDPFRIVWPESEIVAIDRFGNAITSVEGPVKAVRYKGKDIPVGKTYADVNPGEAVAVLGSSGLLELCVRNGSFAERSSASRGEPLDARR
jgi:S-adenosyl-L-methionine hydrolase (adenosine-forming)